VINFKAKHLTDRGYSQHLLGNGGEEELIVVTSWGQDHKSSLVIVGCTIDGAVNMLHDTKGKRVILANVLAVLDRVIEKWAKTGIKPDTEQLIKLDGQRKKTLDRLAELYETGTLPKPVKKSKRKGNSKKSKALKEALADNEHVN
jgi:hypothetical protein